MKRKKTLKGRKLLKIRKDLFVWVLVLVGMVAIAVGDVEQPAGLDTAQEVYAADVDSELNEDALSEDVVSWEAGDPEAKRIQTITFKKDMRIRDALRFLALKYDKNIVPSAKVDGVLAFTNLFDVTFEQAMDAILGRNLKYEQNGNLIKVYTNDEYKQVMEDKDRMVNRVFTLYYISAAEATRLVTPVLSKVGTIQGSTPAETVVRRRLFITGKIVSKTKEIAFEK
jgi:Type II secretory pathway, component PulD